MQKLLAEKDKLEIKIKELKADIEKLQANQFEQFKKAAKIFPEVGTDSTPRFFRDNRVCLVNVVNPLNCAVLRTHGTIFRRRRAENFSNCRRRNRCFCCVRERGDVTCRMTVDKLPTPKDGRLRYPQPMLLMKTKS